MLIYLVDLRECWCFMSVEIAEDGSYRVICSSMVIN